MKNVNRVKFNDDLAEQLGLVCPLTLEIMKNPVISPLGHSFEKSFILEALKTKTECPLTRTPLNSSQLVDNINLRKAILFFEQMSEILKNKKPLIMDNLGEDLAVICPITKEVMINPVVAADGISYERKAIQAYLQKNNNYTPTGQKQKNPLIPNRILQDVIKFYHDIDTNGLEFVDEKVDIIQPQKSDSKSDDDKAEPVKKDKHVSDLDLDSSSDEESDYHNSYGYGERPYKRRDVGREIKTPYLYEHERVLLASLKDYAKHFASKSDSVIIKEEKILNENMKRPIEARNTLLGIRNSLSQQTNKPEYKQADELIRKFNDLLRDLNSKLKNAKDKKNKRYKKKY